jgi:hypothetical protein
VAQKRHMKKSGGMAAMAKKIEKEKHQRNNGSEKLK